MPTVDHEFLSRPTAEWDKYALPWMVRTVWEGGHSKWRRVHRTPRGDYFLMDRKRKRVKYDGPPPPEAS